MLSLPRGNDPAVEVMDGNRFMEPFQRFEAVLVADGKGRMVHRNHSVCLEVEKGLNRFFRIHVDFPTTGAVVGPDGQKGGMDVISSSDLSESIEVSGISRMVGGVLRQLDDKTTEPLFGIVNVAGTPVMGRRKIDFGIPEADTVPVRHFLNSGDVQFSDHSGNAVGNHDRLRTIQNTFQGRAAKVIKMGMGDENKIDRREMLDVDSWIPLSF